MSVGRGVLGALVLGLAMVQPAVAQEKTFGVAVRGGGFNGVTELNEAGNADFNKTGYNVGGGLSVDLHKYIGLRGDFTFARNELQQNGLATSQDLNRFFYDGAVQFQYDANGLKPYLFVGAGAVTLHPVGTTDSDQTKFAGTGGIGAEYAIAGTGLGLVLEGKGWVYNLSELPGTLAPFDKTQFDVTWSAGLSYRLPFGTSAARTIR
ncbi:MAG: outer membrane beta-barrel protein [Gemmatimonadota bacterium]